MYTKTLAALVAATLSGQAIAGPRGYGDRHVLDKKALYTEQVTVTDWVTVTVYEGDETKSSPKAFYTHSHKVRPQSSSVSTTTSDPAPSPVVPTTTIVVQVTSTSVAPVQNSPPPVVEAVPSPSTTSEAVVINTPAPPPPAPSSTAQPVQIPVPIVEVGGGNEGNDGGDEGNGGNTGGNTGASGKRGLVYNNPQLLKSLLNAGTKVSWTYNWGQYDDSDTDLEFCPMLWGLKLDFPQVWPANAQKAIDAGSRCLLSFNEPELEAQANMTPELTAQKHIELMNPFAGKARIGSPGITNGNGPDHGIQWLQRFFTACGGNCAVDFLNIHIYGVDTNTFLSHLRDVHAAFNKPVWITEFAFDGTEEQINSQLETVIDQIETNATYSFVERYSYFMVQDGTMVKGNTPSVYGNTFAYGA